MAGVKGMAPRQGRQNEKRLIVWKAIRMVSPKPFSVPELCELTEQTRFLVRKYIYVLFRGGYLRRVQEAVAARGRTGAARYVLVRNTGIIAPQGRADGSIYDANLKEEQA